MARRVTRLGAAVVIQDRGAAHFLDSAFYGGVDELQPCLQLIHHGLRLLLCHLPRTTRCQPSFSDADSSDAHTYTHASCSTATAHVGNLTGDPSWSSIGHHRGKKGPVEGLCSCVQGLFENRPRQACGLQPRRVRVGTSALIRPIKNNRSAP